MLNFCKSKIESCICMRRELKYRRMEESRYIERKISKYILRAASMYPVVTICGLRQSGKTTLARHLFPDYGYASMENPYTRQAFVSAKI